MHIKDYFPLVTKVHVIKRTPTSLLQICKNTVVKLALTHNILHGAGIISATSSRDYNTFNNTGIHDVLCELFQKFGRSSNWTAVRDNLVAVPTLRFAAVVFVPPSNCKLNHSCKLNWDFGDKSIRGINKAEKSLTGSYSQSAAAISESFRCLLDVMKDDFKPTSPSSTTTKPLCCRQTIPPQTRHLFSVVTKRMPTSEKHTKKQPRVVKAKTYYMELQRKYYITKMASLIRHAGRRRGTYASKNSPLMPRLLDPNNPDYIGPPVTFVSRNKLSGFKEERITVDISIDSACPRALYEFFSGITVDGLKQIIKAAFAPASPENAMYVCFDGKPCDLFVDIYRTDTLHVQKLQRYGNDFEDTNWKDLKAMFVDIYSAILLLNHSTLSLISEQKMSVYD